jgi:glycosyltransferase involved in cell wall biosynthesis
MDVLKLSCRKKEGSMSVSIILLAQHERLLETCLSRIRMYTDAPYDLIVVNDGAIDEPESKWLSKLDCTVITNEVPAGVARGYNQGASAAKGERLVFLRDHMFVSEGWLNSLSVCLDRNEDAAMAGPYSNDVSGEQHMAVACGNMQQLDHTAKALQLTRAGHCKKVNRLLSGFLLVRRDAFDRVGGFDERFGLESFEDDDLCYRLLKEGFSLYIAEDCFVRYMPPPPLFPEDPLWYNRQLERNRTLAKEKWGVDINEALNRWGRPVTVSLCMIVKNEEATLERCLSSVRELVDEIIIVDTGSTDGTKELAARYADRIADFEWVDDFAKARNYAFSLATMEYILWLDADDVVLPADAEKLRAVLSSMEWNVDSVSMHYNLSFDEEGRPAASLRRNRLVKRERNFQWIGLVHEYLEVSGNVMYSDIGITHRRMHQNSTRNLRIYEARMASNETFTPRDTFYFANELRDNKQWERAAAVYEQFLQMPGGWVEDKISACARAADCLAELGRFSEAKNKVIQSFAYALPRAEQCCRLGYYFMQSGEYEEACLWYEQALALPKPSEPNAMIELACWTWLPHLQLCVCYDRLGRREQARSHNEKAASYVPNDSRVLANRRYFQHIS